MPQSRGTDINISVGQGRGHVQDVALWQTQNKVFARKEIWTTDVPLTEASTSMEQVQIFGEGKNEINVSIQREAEVRDTFLLCL